jgi:hypothetical protein
MFLAICYREASAEKLAQFQDEVKKEETEKQESSGKEEVKDSEVKFHIFYRISDYFPIFEIFRFFTNNFQFVLINLKKIVRKTHLGVSLKIRILI